MTEQLNVQQMAQRLMTADNILILCHKNPDGDTIGCGSALYCALKALDKNVAVLCSDAIPNRYAFTNAHMFKGEFEPQTVVAVDVASVQLFGENNGMTQFSRHVDLCIDHHAGNSGYADFTLLNGSAAAAAELLYEVINAMGVAITPHIADCQHYIRMLHHITVPVPQAVLRIVCLQHRLLIAVPCDGKSNDSAGLPATAPPAAHREWRTPA